MRLAALAAFAAVCSGQTAPPVVVPPAIPAYYLAALAFVCVPRRWLDAARARFRR